VDLLGRSTRQVAGLLTFNPWQIQTVVAPGVTDRWTTNPTNTVCFDNPVIAREYIGPAAPVSADSAKSVR
jgi:hypothetical protein